jgi:hypothetical protein
VLVNADNASAFLVWCARFGVWSFQKAQGLTNLVDRHTNLIGNGARVYVYKTVFVAVRQQIGKHQNAVSVAAKGALID